MDRVCLVVQGLQIEYPFQLFRKQLQNLIHYLDAFMTQQFIT